MAAVDGLQLLFIYFGGGEGACLHLGILYQVYRCVFGVSDGIWFR